MIVLHGWWSIERDPRGELIVWAEDSEAPAQPPVRRGRRPAKQAHPFAVPADALAVMTVREGTPGTAVLALPNQGRGPSASAEVHRTRAESPTSVGREAPADGLWEVPTLALDPPNALDFLLESGNDEFDPERPAAGGDLRALQALAGLAVDLVGRGRVLPGVRAAGDGRAMAVWSAVVTGADAVWLRAAAGGLPGSFTAAYPASVDRGEVAVRMLAAATDSLVDAAVRSRLGPGRRRRRRTAASFRSALTGSDPYFAITPVALAALDAALADWQREVTQVGAVRACFRLVEPTGATVASIGEATTGAMVPDPTWRVDFALQSTAEPSLVVDAGQVWRAKGALRALARHVTDPQETLLGELGRAVRLYPDIEGALRTAKPSSLTLDADGAHRFLSDAAPILLAAGFGVLLPSWWTNPSMRLGAKLSVSTPAQPGQVATTATIGRDGLVDFRWDLAVGEHTLTEQEVADLVEAQQPLVRVRGQWMYVDAERLTRAGPGLPVWHPGKRGCQPGRQARYWKPGRHRDRFQRSFFAGIHLFDLRDDFALEYGQGFGKLVGGWPQEGAGPHFLGAELEKAPVVRVGSALRAALAGFDKRAADSLDADEAAAGGLVLGAWSWTDVDEDADIAGTAGDLAGTHADLALDQPPGAIGVRHGEDRGGGLGGAADDPGRFAQGAQQYLLAQLRGDLGEGALEVVNAGYLDGDGARFRAHCAPH